MLEDYTTRINSYAFRCFRDTADYDYIAARELFRLQLHRQFLWMSLQSIEKYIKCILLLNRIPSKKMGHDISKGLHLLYDKLDFPISISNGTANFIEYLSKFGHNRYGELSYYVLGDAIHNLDRATWEIRRYCQSISLCSISTHRQNRKADIRWYRLEHIRLSSESPPENYHLFGGELEKIRDNKKHHLRKTLLWKNFHYWNPCCSPYTWLSHSYSENSALDLHQELAPSLQELIRISR